MVFTKRSLEVSGQHLSGLNARHPLRSLVTLLAGSLPFLGESDFFRPFRPFRAYGGGGIGFAKPLSMVVCRGFSILVVSVLLLLTACGGLTEDLRPLAPGLAIDDPMPEENRDGTYIGSPVNDPGSKDQITVQHNGVSINPDVLAYVNPESVLSCGAGRDSNIKETQFVIDQGEMFETLTFIQPTLTWSDFRSLQLSFNVYCRVFIEVNGVEVWRVSDVVTVSTRKKAGPTSADGPDVFSPPPSVDSEQ